MPVHIEFTIISILSPILILLVLPPHRVRITDWGENTLFCYLVHPFGLKLVYKPAAPRAALRGERRRLRAAANLLLFLILSVLPLVVQIGLCHLSIVLKATYQVEEPQGAAPEQGGGGRRCGFRRPQQPLILHYEISVLHHRLELVVVDEAAVVEVGLAY